MTTEMKQTFGHVKDDRLRATIERLQKLFADFDTTADVVSYLRLKKITGHICAMNACPLANLVRGMYPEAIIDVNTKHIYIEYRVQEFTDDESDYIGSKLDLCRQCSEFVRLFDSGNYPDLITKGNDDNEE